MEESSRVAIVVAWMEAQLPRNHVASDVGEVAFVPERVTPQPRHRVPDAHRELDGDHPCGLVDDELQIGTAFELGTQHSRLGVCLEQEKCLRSDVRHHQCISVLIVAQIAGAIVVEVERPQPDDPYLQREPEHRPRAGGDGGTGEGEPARNPRVREVRFENRPVALVGVNARTFAKLELQLLELSTDRVG